MEDLTPDSLSKEKSLWEIFKKTLEIKESFLNLFLLIVVFIVISIYTIFFDKGLTESGFILRSLADTGAGFSTSILGFLIAGFTIFTSIADKSLFVSMAKERKDGYTFSWLKFVFFVFMKVFIHYFVFTCLCYFVKIFFTENGIISSFLGRASEGLLVKGIFLKTTLVVIGTYLVYLLILLKSFLFNIYEVSMMAIRWQFEVEEGSV